MSDSVNSYCPSRTVSWTPGFEPFPLSLDCFEWFLKLKLLKVLSFSKYIFKLDYILIKCVLVSLSFYKFSCRPFSPSRSLFPLFWLLLPLVFYLDEKPRFSTNDSSISLKSVYWAVCERFLACLSMIFRESNTLFIKVFASTNRWLSCSSSSILAWSLMNSFLLDSMNSDWSI